MIHRHLNTSEWTRSAIDSALEYGDLADWRELFAEVRRDERLAKDVLWIVQSHPVPGASLLARALVIALWPMLADKAGTHEDVV